MSIRVSSARNATRGRCFERRSGGQTRRRGLWAPQLTYGRFQNCPRGYYARGHAGSSGPHKQSRKKGSVGPSKAALKNSFYILLVNWIIYIIYNSATFITIIVCNSEFELIRYFLFALWSKFRLFSHTNLNFQFLG